VTETDSVDPASVDWPQVAQSAYLIHQRMTYEYPTPIEDLEHKLVVLPPMSHGDQRRITYQLEVSHAEHRMTTRRDAFGNLVVDLSVPRVERSIDFQAWMVVERRASRGSHRVRRRWLRDRRLLEPSPLTQPDDILRRVAADLMATEGTSLALAARISSWVHGAMTYERGATDVTTTAAEALSRGRGVCQDYAHLMIAICRLCGIPARYVSGHLVGEGAMHAWVEVLLPSAEYPQEAIAWPFDPTHDRAPSLSYLTVAVGRDYGDVSPTRGTFRAPASGRLSSHWCVSLTEVQYGLFHAGLFDVA
jgi:transglutaminase-like putative cysteine protease